VNARRLVLRAMGASALVPALASLAGRAHAQSAPYRAMVCVFLYGGNDGNNTVLPYDDYTNYAAGRPNGGNGAALAKGELLPIAPSNLTRKFGFHPQLAPLVPLFEQRKLAVVCNTGTLVAPITKADYARWQESSAQPVLAQRPDAGRARRHRRCADAERLGRPLDRRGRRGQRGRRRARHGVALR
jgi:uncharacterized protein (DUF1501 family)